MIIVEVVFFLVQTDEELVKGKGVVKEVIGELGGCGFRKLREYRFFLN